MGLLTGHIQKSDDIRDRADDDNVGKKGKAKKEARPKKEPQEGRIKIFK